MPKTKTLGLTSSNAVSRKKAAARKGVADVKRGVPASKSKNVAEADKRNASMEREFRRSSAARKKVPYIPASKLTQS